MRICKLLFGLLFICPALFAQQGIRALNPSKPLSQYIITVWDKNEGLPSQSLTKVMQSADGYLWASSYNGLYRFDGVVFKTLAKTSKGILRTNSFSKVKEDENGLMYVGTGGSGLLTYSNGEFSIFGGESPRFDAPISSFHFGDNGKVWVGARGAGLYIFEKDKFSAYEREPLLNHVTISSILETKDGSLWFATEGNGIIKLKGEEIAYLNEGNGLPSGKASALCQAGDGRVWIGTHQGVYSFDEGGSVQLLKGTEGYFINHIVEDAYGSIWIGTTKGLFRLNAYTDQLEFLSTKDGLPHSNIADFTFDNEGNLWIATYRGGICRLKDTHFENYSQRDGIAAATINSVCELNNNQVLIATGNSLHLLENGQISPKPVKTEIPSAWFKHVNQISNGDILLSTYSGLLFISPDGKEYLLDDSKGLPDNQVRVSYEDKEGNIWIGTRAGGAIKIDPDTKSFSVYKESNQQLSSDFVMSITQDREGNMLFGLNNKGLDVRSSSGELTNYGIDKIGSNLIFNIYVDAENNYWMGTNAGLTLMRPDKSTVHFTKLDGLGSDVIFDILEDKQGNIWLTSSDGLLRITKQELLDFAIGKLTELNSKVYTKDDGMVESECTGVTQSLKASTEKLYFPTLGGLTIYDPNYPLAALPSAQVYVDKVLLDNQPVDLYNGDLTFDANIKRAVFHYTALHLSSPSQVKFQYKLEGYEDWVDAGAERKAIYTNIEPGKQEFKVRASHDGSSWKESEIGTLRFYREPHITETIWFYIAISLALIAGGYALYINRVRGVKRRNQELEDTVNQRTQELQSQHEVLRQKQEEILTQNEELFQQQEEITTQRDHIEYKNQELSQQKEQIEKAYNNVHLLAEIGQSITAALDLASISQRTYERVNLLMDASGFGICVYDEAATTITFEGYVEKGEVLDIYVGQYMPTKDLASWCIANQKYVLLNNLEKEYAQYLEPGSFRLKAGDTPVSLIYVPLTLKGKSIGAVTVQSFKEKAYSKQDVDLLLNLATYISIAVENSEVYREIKKSYNIIESKNQDIMDSLRYAETIQKSVLPTTENINKCLANHFVLFRPKDVVSGDFYWCKEVDGRVFTAVVDCTGHGVPGAFMSMIGNDLLDTIITRESVYNPAEILSLMNQGVHSALQQDKQQNSDGMDMLICMIEYKESDVEVVFAGAKRPLFYLESDVLKEEKGDRKSVGGWQKEEKPVYTNIPLKLQKGDFLYLTTDGYVDQASPEGRKYGTGNLRKLFQSFIGTDIETQGQKLTTTLDEHQKDYHQRDDITMLILEL